MIALSVIIGEGVLDRFPNAAFCFLGIRLRLAALLVRKNGRGIMKCWVFSCRRSRSSRASCWSAASFISPCEPEEKELAHVVDIIGDGGSSSLPTTAASIVAFLALPNRL